MPSLTKSSLEQVNDLKNYIKTHSHKGGGLTHSHFVLYAALRGKDIRKTSHQPDGDNAFECLEELIDATHGCFFAHPTLCVMKNEQGRPLFSMKDFNPIRIALFNARNPKNQNAH